MLHGMKGAARGGQAQKPADRPTGVVSGTQERGPLTTLLWRERVALEDLRQELRQSQSDIEHSMVGVSTLRSELDLIWGTANQLSQDCTRLRDMSRAAKDESTAATEKVAEVQQRLGSLLEIQELSALVETTNAKATAVANAHASLSQEAERIDADGRALLDAVRTDLQALRTEKAEVTALHERLTSGRGDLEAFVNRMEQFMVRVPQFEVTIDAIVAKLAAVQEVQRTMAEERLATLQSDLEQVTAKYKDDQGRELTIAAAETPAVADRAAPRRGRIKRHRGGAPSRGEHQTNPGGV
jgi:chromosome segregation ATPase